MSKTLDNTNTADAKSSTDDVKVTGNPDMWQLLCKASSAEQGWMKSTKAMDIGTGCLVQVTTQQAGQLSDALTYVPGAFIGVDRDGHPKLISHS